MNIIFNNKLILISTVGALMMSGCIAEKSLEKNSFIKTKTNSNVKKSKTWKDISQERKECPDCYASDIGIKSIQPNHSNSKEEYISYNYSNTKRSYIEYRENGSIPNYIDNTIDTQSYGAYDYVVSPSDTYYTKNSENIVKITPKQNYINSSKDSFNTKLTSDTTIQVGAFRHYSGAKKIARKYSLLSSQYSVKIETGIKDGAPIHRVRIYGFHSKGQAKAFMQRYAISDAFLVRR